MKTAILTGSDPVAVDVGDVLTPFTVTLTSAAPGRLIELSTNGGLAGSWYSPGADASTGGMINVAVMAPVSHVRVTGVANDVWRIQ